MTGANTDRVETPQYVLVASALLRLAGPFFVRIGETLHCGVSCLVVWQDLRKFSAGALEHRGLRLGADERIYLNDLLDLCPESDDVDFIRGLTWAERGAA
jgi:hypothetical protein